MFKNPLIPLLDRHQLSDALYAIETQSVLRDACRRQGAPQERRTHRLPCERSLQAISPLCGWQINLHIKGSIHRGVFDRSHWLNDSQRMGRGASENKRADWRHHLVIYSVRSAQFFPFPTSHDTIKRNGRDSFQPKTSAPHTKEKSIGLTQNPYKPLKIKLLSLVRYF